MKSNFLIFFLSCSSSNRFYMRKKREYNSSIFKNLADKFTNSPKKVQTAQGNNEITDIMDQLDMREDTVDDEKFKINVFLEDLYTTTKINKKPLTKAKDVIDDLCGLFKKVSEKVKDLAQIFEDLGTSFGQMEKNKTKEMDSIKPKIGRVCEELKTGFFGLSNLMENKRSQVRKLVIPFFEGLAKGNNRDSETLIYRKRILKQYIHTVKQRTKGKKESFTRKQQLFGVEKLVILHP